MANQLSPLRSPIGITMGCPVGIGPEIILRFFHQRQGRQAADTVVIGDIGVLRRCAAALQIPVSLALWQPGESLPVEAIPVLSLSALPASLAWGRPDAVTGRAMGRYIEQAVALCRTGDLAAMVTCPITKTALAQAGYRYPGHTEMLADLCGTSSYAMMLAGARLRVTLVTIHCALKEVAARLNQQAIVRLIALTGNSLRQDFGLAAPRLAVAGLNPHAGESGMFGDEEQRSITPAVQQAVSQGWDVRGPLPPDTVFHQAAGGAFDAVVCMYHDQGLIPFKLLHFADGVNMTIGLPVVRTSVDHGTAYDIAGQGKASCGSLVAAWQLAASVVDNRRRFAGQGERE